MVGTYVREVQAIKFDGSNVQEIADFLGVEINDIKLEEVSYMSMGDKTIIARVKAMSDVSKEEIRLDIVKGEYAVKEIDGSFHLDFAVKFEKLYKKK